MKPKRKGTKKLCKKYGIGIVRVTYRYDMAGNKRYKTVELIEEETEWMPPVKENAEPTDEIVGISVGYKETKLQGRLKKEGAKWDPRKKVWVLGLAKAEKKWSCGTASPSATWATTKGVDKMVYTYRCLHIHVDKNPEVSRGVSHPFRQASICI